MSRLTPPHQPVPNNLALFLANAGLMFTLVLLTWISGMDRIRSALPYSASETATLIQAFSPDQAYVEQAHPFFAQVEQWSRSGGMDLLILNRWISALGFVGGLIVLFRLLARQTTGQLAMAGVALWLVFPGIILLQIGAGGTGLSVWLFLLTLSALSGEGDTLIRLRAGLCAGLLVWLDPVWGLPVTGLLVGIWETDRRRFKVFLPALAVSLVLGFGLTLFWRSGGAYRLIPARLPPGLSQSWGPWMVSTLHEHLVLWLAVPLILIHGFTRRGITWWLLLLSIPGACLAPWFHVDPLAGLLPMVLVLCLSVPRLPALLGIRFPVVYQSLLTLQLLLWLPGYLQPGAAAAAAEWLPVEHELLSAPGEVLANTPAAARLLPSLPVTLTDELLMSDPALADALIKLTDKGYTYVILTESRPFPDELREQLEQSYQQTSPPGAYSLWIPRTELLPGFR